METRFENVKRLATVPFCHSEISRGRTEQKEISREGVEWSGREQAVKMSERMTFL